MTAKEKTPKYLIDLSSGDPKKVIAALDQIKTKGDRRAVLPMLRVMVQYEEGAVLDKAQDILNTIKDQQAVPGLFLALEEDEFRSIRKIILTGIWQSGLTVNDRLAHLVDIAIESGFEEAFECVTIIENQADPFPEEQLLDATIALRSHLQDSGEDERTALLEGLLQDLEQAAPASA